MNLARSMPILLARSFVSACAIRRKQLASSHVSAHAAKRRQLSICQARLVPDTAFVFSVWSGLPEVALPARGPSAMLHMQQRGSARLRSWQVKSAVPYWTGLKSWTAGQVHSLHVAAAIDMAWRSLQTVFHTRQRRAPLPNHLACYYFACPVQ